MFPLIKKVVVDTDCLLFVERPRRLNVRRMIESGTVGDVRRVTGEDFVCNGD